METDIFQGKEYIYEVYKEKSISKAAEKLYISQPSLSANIKRIENRIGSPVFDRSTKPLGLTECGRRYVEAVEKVMGIEKEFTAYIDDLESMKRGQLTIGGSSLYASFVLPPMIAEFSGKYPGLRVNLIEESTLRLENLLKSGQLDIMLDNGEMDTEVFERSIWEKEHIFLAVPAAFEINEEIKEYCVPADVIHAGAYDEEQYPAVPVAKFRELPFIFLKPGNDTEKRARSICRESAFEPNVILELDQQMTTYNVTCSGLGISFIGEMLIARVPVNENVRYYRLAGPMSERSIWFYWKKGRYLSRAQKEFLGMGQQ